MDSIQDLPNNFQKVENKVPLLNLEKLNNDPDKELVLFELPKNVNKII